MKTEIRSLAFATLFSVPAVGLASADSVAIGVSHEDALRLPIEELAKRSVQGLFTEVSRPNFVGGLTPPTASLGALQFATHPETAGVPGMCKADVVAFEFEPMTGWRAKVDNHSSVRARRIEAWEAYKIVDETKPLPDMWNDRYGAWLKQRCLRAGPVIPSAEANLGQHQFFRLKHQTFENGGIEAWVVARVLHLALKQAVEPDRFPVTCSSFSERELAREECKDVRRLVHSLDLDALLEAGVERCAEQRTLYCISATFIKEGGPTRRTTWEVTVRVRIEKAEQAYSVVQSIGQVEIGQGFDVWD